MAQANIEDLYNLYQSLNKAMQDADAIINDVDGKFNLARNEWKSAGADTFDGQWNGFKPSLAEMCRAFAGAGTSVAQQHNDFAKGAQEQNMHPVLAPLTSPR